MAINLERARRRAQAAGFIPGPGSMGEATKQQPPQPGANPMGAPGQLTGVSRRIRFNRHNRRGHHQLS